MSKPYSRKPYFYEPILPPCATDLENLLGVSHINAQILGLVAKHPGCFVREIVEHINSSTCTVSTILQRMKRWGYIKPVSDGLFARYFLEPEVEKILQNYLYA